MEIFEREEASECKKILYVETIFITFDRWLYIYILSKKYSLHLWVMNSVKGIPSVVIYDQLDPFSFRSKIQLNDSFNYFEEDFTRDVKMWS